MKSFNNGNAEWDGRSISIDIKDGTIYFDHCAVVLSVINNIDLIIKEKESFERGKKIAKE